MTTKTQKIGLGLFSILSLLLAACSTPGNNMYGQSAQSDYTHTKGLGQPTQVYGENVYGTTTNAPANQSYYFAFDKSFLRQNYYPSIDAQANYLLSHPKAKVLLAGNTDDRGSREYNIALGERRAQSVASRLKIDGVNPSQIKTISYGAEKPVALGQTKAAYAMNRRTDLTYMNMR